jgi:hypothetical protein
MPRIDRDGEMQQHALGGSFGFSAIKVDKLGASSYTLVTIMVDVTGSVAPFAAQLKKMLEVSLESCKKSPQSDNLLVRTCTFNSSQGVVELHGFRQLCDVDPASYPVLRPSGMTPLYDAVYSAVGATNAYGKQLRDADYGCNAIVIVITDGVDNASTATMSMIKDEVGRLVKGEELESCVSILIGVCDPAAPDPGAAAALDEFRREAGFTHFVDAGSATPGRIAKLAAFVSRSISSQSQALGTGGPSQNIQATI